jgi:hypothetical protein
MPKRLMRLTFSKTLLMPVMLLATATFFGLYSRAAEQSVQKYPSFEPEVLPIFQANCLACHSGAQGQKGLDLTTRDSALKGGESGPAILPGSAAQSLLYRKVSSGVMPPGGNKLSPVDIEMIRRWIEAGALKDGEDPKIARKNLQNKPLTEREILVSILHVKCLVCHGKQVADAGLDMRTRDGLLKGGKSGPAIILGKAEESLLIKRIGDGHPTPEMQNEYFVRPVTSDEAEKLSEWIAAGAPPELDEVLRVGDGPDPLLREEDRKFWSFQAPKRGEVPTVRNQSLVRTPIDAFLLEKLEAKGLSFSAEAEPLTLLRRAYFDLIGLPPEPEAVKAYLEDQKPGAYERVIDRLLASPQYGERWARFWLDAAGYADSEGGGGDSIRPHAYRYRDYVIRSLNADKAYDQFLLEQIAGDELFDYKAIHEPTPVQLDYLVATGFLRMTPDRTHEHDANFVPTRLETVADSVEMLSSSVMGLTMGCARCHSHKFDPIPQRDYYRFSAILRTAYDPYDWLIPNKLLGGTQKQEPPERYLTIVPEKERREVETYNAPIQAEIAKLEHSLKELSRPWEEKVLEENLSRLPAEVRADVRKAFETPQEKRTPLQMDLLEKYKPSVAVTQQDLKERFKGFKEQAEKLSKVIEQTKNRLRPQPRIRALFDMGGEPTPTRILLRGDPANPGQRVEAGVPSVLREGIAPYQVIKPLWTTGTSGYRLALARWLIQPNHPLTSRVIVNRIWQQHFENGIVVTPENFGHLGAKPTHPELLDWLATEFVQQKWSIKTLHKVILTSSVYRQSSRFNPAALSERDPDNALLSRFPMRRMDGDQIRDSILKVSGRLDLTPFGPPEGVEVTAEGEVLSKAMPSACGGSVCLVPAVQSEVRRSIYTLVRRETPLTLLEVFDAPQLQPNCLKRGYSTVATQALQLLNGNLIRESARYFAGRTIDLVSYNVEKQVELVYLAALSRPPTEQEISQGVEAVQTFTQQWLEQLQKEVPAEPRQTKAQWLGLASFCHIILNSPDFIYID